MSLYTRHRHRIRQPVSLSAAGDDHQIHDYVPVLAHPDDVPMAPVFSPGNPHIAPVVSSRKRRDRGAPISGLRAMGMAGQIGYILAIPAVLLGFGGAYLDKYMGTTPVFILGGLVLAFISSTMAVKRVIDQLNPPEKNEEKTDQKM